MTLRFFTIAVLGSVVMLACGSSGSDPIFSGGGKAGSAGSSGAPGGSGGSSGKAGAGSGGSAMAGSGTGGSSANGGTGGRGGAGAATGGTSGESGSPGEAGSPADGGTAGVGGSSGGTGAGLGGEGGTAGTACEAVHPNVNGNDRTCNAGYCYCSDNDGCFLAAVASSCCNVTVVCGEQDPQEPIVTINHPGDGETRPPNDSIPFAGVAADPQDGALSGASLVWTSSLRSTPIGTGLSFDAALEVGTHVITLTAIDSDSNVGTDSVTLYIQ